MKKKLFLVLASVATLLWNDRVFAAGEVKTDLQRLVAEVQTKVGEGKRTEAALAGELKGFDDLLAKHQDEKTDEVAQVLYMKAMLYLQVIDDSAKGEAVLKKLKADFPETTQGKQVDNVLEQIKRSREGAAVRKNLVIGKVFPDFSETDLDGKPLSIANFKGKLVLVDFWATWCGPCVGELPNVLKTYEKYHGQGFEIVGISLDSDREKLTGFLKKNNMTWVQFYDGKGWGNKLSGKYGITSIPATFLLDGEGKIIDTNLRGEALEKAVARELAKKSR